MTYYEGVLVTDHDSLNAAAIGAEIDEARIGCQIYMPSDTARKLEDDVDFTFSLTTDPELFYKAALTGHNDPETSELEKDSLEREGPYLYPEQATRTYYCRVESNKEITEEDEYGEARIKLVEGKVLEIEGDLEHIGRENPLVDAMVHATRMFVADREQRKAIKERVENILKGHEYDLKRKILDFVEGKTDEV